MNEEILNQTTQHQEESKETKDNYIIEYLITDEDFENWD